MATRKLIVQRLGVWPVVKFGCALGWLVALVPSIPLALLVWSLLSRVLNWLQGLQSFQILSVRFDFVRLLNLERLQQSLQTLNVASAGFLVALVIALSLLGGLVVALALLLFTLGFNLLAWLSGGLTLYVVESPRKNDMDYT